MLFFRELKKTVWGIPYVLFVIVVVFTLHSQGALNFSSDKITRPAADGNFGTKNEEVPEIIMPAALQSLYREFLENNYKTYPIGFLKNVKLDDSGQREIAEIISAITGVDAAKLYNMQGGSYNDGNGSLRIGDEGVVADGDGGFVISQNQREDDAQEENVLTVKEDMPYAEFKDLMQRVDDLLGGGSDYGPQSLIGYGKVPVTYEEAKERYALAVSHDKITGGYARLFSDYAVAMTLSVLPVLLAVIMGMKDRRAKMSELIYTRKAYGVKVVFVRYLALVTAVMLPVIILSYVSGMSVWSMYPGMELDYLAPLKYDFGWIMPSVMTASAVGMFFTELTNTPIAVAVQGLWWFVDINMGMKSVSASFSLLRLAPRHNAGAIAYFRTQDFIDNFQNLLANRLFFAGLSVVLVAITAVIYEEKRKGKLYGNRNIQKIFAGIGNRKNKYQA